MSKNKKLTHNEKIIKALEKIKTPIFDELRNLNIFFKERSRSNESGLEHIAKSYHNLDSTDIDLLVEGIKHPFKHIKDKRFPKTYCYYYKRKRDRKNYIKVVVKVEKDLKTAYISSIFITSKIK